MRTPAFSQRSTQLASLIEPQDSKLNHSRDYAVKVALEQPELLRDSLRSVCPDSMSIDSKEIVLQALFGEHLFKKEGWLSGRETFDQFQALVQIGCSIRQAVKENECPLLKHEHINELIDLIAFLERPEYRPKLLDAFDQLIKRPAIRQSNYIELTKSLSVYGLPQSMLIYPMMSASSLSLDEKKTVMQDYGNKGFKNAFKLRKMLDFLVRLEVFASRPDIQAQLLRATCPSVDESCLGKKQVLPKLLANINLMQVVIPFIEAGDSALIEVDINELNSPKALLESVKQSAIFVLGHEPTAENYAAIEKYFERIDDPSCLLVWAARQHEFCKKSSGRGFKNLELVKEASSWILNEDQVSRYQANKSLLLLKDKNEQAYRRWCELEAQPNLTVTPMNIHIDYSGYMEEEGSCVELEFDGLVENNNVDKFGQFIELSRKSGWAAKVTSNLDDLLTCGTRVPGSCQNVNEDGSLNQGLIGYIKTAKMAGVWQGDALFGRNMLFLGWDAKQSKHVIVVAHHAYGQPECNDGYREVMKLAAQKYANWVGLELVDAAGSFHDPLNLLVTNSREVVIPLSDPTYIDGMGVCSHDIQLKVKDTSFHY